MNVFTVSASKSLCDNPFHISVGMDNFKIILTEMQNITLGWLTWQQSFNHRQHYENLHSFVETKRSAIKKYTTTRILFLWLASWSRMNVNFHIIGNNVHGDFSKRCRPDMHKTKRRGPKTQPCVKTLDKTVSYQRNNKKE